MKRTRQDRLLLPTFNAAHDEPTLPKATIKEAHAKLVKEVIASAL